MLLKIPLGAAGLTAIGVLWFFPNGVSLVVALILIGVDMFLGYQHRKEKKALNQSLIDKQNALLVLQEEIDQRELKLNTFRAIGSEVCPLWFKQIGDCIELSTQEIESLTELVNGILNDLNVLINVSDLMNAKDDKSIFEMDEKLMLATSIFSEIEHAQNLSERQALLEKGTSQSLEIKQQYKKMQTLLSDCAGELAKTTQQVNDEIERILFSVQFQDRMAQILQHVRDNMNDFSEQIQQDKVIKIADFLQKMQAGFTTAEERIAYRSQMGEAQTQPEAEGGDVTFF